MLTQTSDHLHLLLGRKSPHCRLNNATRRSLVDRNEALVVHVGERAHDELAIHAVSHAAVAWDAIAKVLDVEGAF